jgi:hypothetical protein
MSAYTIVTAQERGRFDALRKSMVRADGPAFLDRRRIDGYDGQQVTYHFRSHKSERVERETVDVYTLEYVDQEQ